MPYLPLDIDAKRRLEAIERALALPRLSLVGGAMDLWETVWREKSAVVDELALCSSFGPDPRICQALTARCFLEPLGDGRHRVRGADKWLFGLEGKSRGGKASKGNLVPGPKPKGSAEEPKEPETNPSASAEAKPKPPLGSPSALSPSSPAPSNPTAFSSDASAPASDQLGLAGVRVEQVIRGAEPEKRGPGRPFRAKAEKQTDPRHHPLKLRLMATYLDLRKEVYDFTGACAKALADLLAKGTDDQIDARWRRGLQGQFKERCDSLLDLRTKWNTLTGTGPPARAGGARFINAQDVNQAAFENIGAMNDF